MEDILGRAQGSMLGRSREPAELDDTEPSGRLVRLGAKVVEAQNPARAEPGEQTPRLVEGQRAGQVDRRTLLGGDLKSSEATPVGLVERPPVAMQAGRASAGAEWQCRVAGSTWVDGEPVD